MVIETFLYVINPVEHFLDDLSQSLDTQSTQYPLLWNVINRTVRDIYKISQYDIWPELTDFFVGMKMEYMRRINKSILSKNEIEKIFNSGFRGPQQIYLVWLGSEYTIDDIHELPIILWRVYSLRDLEWDLNNWICNIPYEILDIMWYKLIPRYSEIKNHHLLNVWIVEVCQEQRNNIDLLKNKIQYGYSELRKFVDDYCQQLKMCLIDYLVLISIYLL